MRGVLIVFEIALVVWFLLGAMIVVADARR